MTEPIEQSTVTCGCGFTASGHDEMLLKQMIIYHPCTTSRGEVGWWLTVPWFSFAVVVGVVALCAVR